MRLNQKVAVISAAASGMGREGALLFAKEGAKVNILDINEEGGEKVVKEIQNNGGEAHFYKTDLTDLNGIKAAIEKINEMYGRINILWNHVGIPGPPGLEEVEEKDYDLAMLLNVKSGFFTTKHVVPFMKAEGGGSIIFTSSVSGLVASPYSPVYSTAKGAIVNLVRSLAVYLAKENIRVNGICPGLTETPMLKQFVTRSKDDDLEENKRYILSRIPLGRFGHPIDIANAALFLASDESSYISGVNLPVDGAYIA
jgi:NAD(P)-dependent dehydrogenase (short-subunit alcohol dehydrogenase family)